MVTMYHSNIYQGRIINTSLIYVFLTCPYVYSTYVMKFLNLIIEHFRMLDYVKLLTLIKV